MKLYLAGPIGDQTIEEANAWRKKAEDYFGTDYYWIDVRNPLRGKTEDNRKKCTDAEIILRDKNDIQDLVLVYWPERCVSNGTAMEIIYAWEHEVPVIFVGDWAKEDVWVRYHVAKIVSNLDDALKYIVDMWL